MTTAHRPTFDPARGKEALRGPAYHQRLLPAHTQLKYRKPGQGGIADPSTAAEKRDLAAALLAAEAKHFSKKGGAFSIDNDGDQEMPDATTTIVSSKRSLIPLDKSQSDLEGEDNPEAKRQRILAATRDIDADDSDSGSDASSNSSEDESDSEDEQAELMRELARVKREKALKREKEEMERRKAEEDARVRDIAQGNPLLNSGKDRPDFTIRRRWDDDVVFKNQARDVDDRGKPKEFVNDMLRSDFHKRFMNKYVK